MNVYEQVEFLKEENRQLKEMLSGPETDFPKEWGLKLAEQRLLRSLCAAKGVRTHETLLRACALGDFVEDNLLKVHISNIRKKLKPHGVEIKTVWGVGYELPEHTQKEVKKYITFKPIFTLPVHGVAHGSL